MADSSMTRSETRVHVESSRISCEEGECITTFKNMQRERKARKILAVSPERVRTVLRLQRRQIVHDKERLRSNDKLGLPVSGCF